MFWALPLAIGIWLHWGDSLQFTVYDGLVFTLLVSISVYEMVKSTKLILEDR